MKRRKDDLKQATKKQLDELRRSSRKDPKHAVNVLLARAGVKGVRVGSKVYSVSKPKRRPSTKTLHFVYAWLQEQGLQVYGPNVDLEKGKAYGSCMDYNVAQMLQLARLRKQHPKGIPYAEFDDDVNEENAG